MRGLDFAQSVRFTRKMTDTQGSDYLVKTQPLLNSFLFLTLTLGSLPAQDSLRAVSEDSSGAGQERRISTQTRSPGAADSVAAPAVIPAPAAATPGDSAAGRAAEDSIGKIPPSSTIRAASAQPETTAVKVSEDASPWESAPRQDTADVISLPTPVANPPVRKKTESQAADRQPPIPAPASAKGASVPPVRQQTVQQNSPPPEPMAADSAREDSAAPASAESSPPGPPAVSAEGGINPWVYWVAAIIVAGLIAALLVINRSSLQSGAPSKAIPRVEGSKGEAPPPIDVGSCRLQISLAQDDGGFYQQQDVAGFTLPPGAAEVPALWVAVADGLEGHQLPREAAQVAVDACLNHKNSPAGKKTSNPALSRLRAANDAVRRLAEQNDAVDDVACTLTTAVFQAAGLFWASVGDTRLYLLREGRLRQLNEDHAFRRFLKNQVEAGKLSAREARKHPQREALTSFLGLPELREVSQNESPFTFQPGDCYLLCTAGLHNRLTAEEMRHCLTEQQEKTGERLVAAALRKKYPRAENLTAMTIMIEKRP